LEEKWSIKERVSTCRNFLFLSYPLLWIELYGVSRDIRKINTLYLYLDFSSLFSPYPHLQALFVVGVFGDEQAAQFPVHADGLLHALAGVGGQELLRLGGVLFVHFERFSIY